MKLCNETITVINAKFDPETRMDKYYPTVITGASWFCEIASNVTDDGLKAANVFTVRIPTDAYFGGKTYADPVAYAEAGDVSAIFTLRNGDIVVKGVSKGDTPADIQKANAEMFKVLGVTDNRRAPNAKHWKLVGA